MKLSIIIPSYNTASLTKQCLQSLQQLNDLELGQDFEVIVVDNHSTDESVAIIKNEFPQITLVESDENLGFSKANNLGIKHIHSDSPYVLFLNSDTTVPEGTLSEMLQLMQENQSIGVATCKVMLWTGGIDLDCHRGFPTPWVSLSRLCSLHKLFPRTKLFNGYYQGWKDLDTTHEIDSSVGAFMLVRRPIGNEVTWWDEDYFLNGEDIDLCYRIKQAGHKVVYHPQVVITHYRGASKGTRKESSTISTASKKTKVVVADASVNAMDIFYNKHLRDKYPWIINKSVDLFLPLLKLKRRLLTK